jgi:hypothetical protein
MGCIIEKIIFKSGVDQVDKKTVPHELWDISINDIDGKQTALNQYTSGKKAFIFVNVACK